MSGLQFNLDRTASLELQIERQLRSNIRSGRLVPGQRLPSTAQLARQCRVSCRSIQRVMERLDAGGLVGRTRKRGTIVKAATEKAMIAILVGVSLNDERSFFYRALVKLIQSEIHDASRHDPAVSDESRPWNWFGRVYDGLNLLQNPDELRASAQYQSLVSDVLLNPLKGVITIALEHELAPSFPLLANAPRVVWTTESPDVFMDLQHFAQASAEYVGRLGAKRIVIFHTVERVARVEAGLKALENTAREQGMARPEVVQFQSVHRGASLEKEGYERACELIRNAKATGEWPDALLVSDDVAMRGVAFALLQHGVEVPRRLQVITFASEGTDIHYPVPVVRYLVRLPVVARRMLEILLERVAGRSVPNLPDLFRGELVAPEN